MAIDKKVFDIFTKNYLLPKLVDFRFDSATPWGLRHRLERKGYFLYESAQVETASNTSIDT